jgi:hypothetical protein
MLDSNRRTSTDSRRCLRPSALGWSASRTIIDASENSSYYAYSKMRARRKSMGLISVRYERSADIPYNILCLCSGAMSQSVMYLLTDHVCL